MSQTLASSDGAFAATRFKGAVGRAPEPQLLLFCAHWMSSDGTLVTKFYYSRIPKATTDH